MERAAALWCSGPRKLRALAASARGYGEEGHGPATDPVDINELQYTCRRAPGLEHVTRALACHVAPDNALELVVHQWQQLLHRLRASGPPLEEERRQVMDSRIRHGFRSTCQPFYARDS